MYLSWDPILPLGATALQKHSKKCSKRSTTDVLASMLWSFDTTYKTNTQSSCFFVQSAAILKTAHIQTVDHNNIINTAVCPTLVADPGGGEGRELTFDTGLLAVKQQNRRLPSH